MPAQIFIGGTVGGQIITSARTARWLMRITFAARRDAEVWYEELRVT
jgi:hypothetical protein